MILETANEQHIRKFYVHPRGDIAMPQIARPTAFNRRF